MPDFELFESILLEESIGIESAVDISVVDELNVSEFTDRYLGINIVADDNLTGLEFIGLYLDTLFGQGLDELTVTEIVAASFDYLHIGLSDEIVVSERIELLDVIIELGIALDDITTADILSILMQSHLDILEPIDVIEFISMDLIINFNTSDDVLIMESAYVLDIVVELFCYETINSVDRGFLFKVENFSEFLRGYPFIEITETGIDKIEFEDGVLQMVDRWGRIRKRFEITMPISTKDEAMPVKEFFERNIGRRFYFTNPLDKKTYDVTFEESSYRLSRSHFDTYEAELVLVEVF